MSFFFGLLLQIYNTLPQISTLNTSLKRESEIQIYVVDYVDENTRDYLHLFAKALKFALAKPSIS